MNDELFVKIALALISLCSALITGVIIPYVKNKIGDAKFERLIYYVSVAVRCAEQIYTTDQWREKKEYVMKYVMDIVNEHLHVSISYDELDTIVEGIVNETKYPNGRKDLEAGQVEGK